MGYRRTGSNIFKTRSNKKMTSLVSKTMAFGMLAPFAVLGSSNSSISANSSYYDSKPPKHYSSKKHKIGIIIFGVLAILCPIAGFVTFCIADDWWIATSIVIFGPIEFFLCALMHLHSSEGYNKYIYKDEEICIEQEFKKNLDIINKIGIALLVINIYPIFIFATPYYYTLSYSDCKGCDILLSIIPYIIKISSNIFFVSQVRDDKKRKMDYFFFINQRLDTNNTLKNSFKDSCVQKRSKDNYDTNLKSNFSLPPIKGEYSEEFMDNYGTLRIGSTHAFIEFYFPGPDARYKGTFISINENDIDKYINAYKNNWQTAEKLQVKIFDTPDAKFNQLGEMGMNITVSHNSITLCIDSYHLPICSRKECDDIINHLNIAKHRIKEIRQRLFDK